jgi:hypothetical protein
VPLEVLEGCLLLVRGRVVHVSEDARAELPTDPHGAFVPQLGIARLRRGERTRGEELGR